jgi:lysophospholipase L1-like esterase
MSARIRRRLGALALGVAAGALAAWALAEHRREQRELVTVAGSRAELDAALRERARTRGAAAPPAARPVRARLSAEEAARLYAQLRMSPEGVEHDPYTHYRYRGGLERWIESGDHPGGGFTFRTNAAGFREDGELADAPPDLRVVVAGDSHTDGICANADSFPNLLEAELARRHPGASVEVVNTGKAGYSFHQYLGVLDKLLAARPDVFVMAVYGGNDFVEALLLDHWLAQSAPPACAECSHEGLHAAHPDVLDGALLQAYRQIAYFRHHPEERARALAAACAVTEEVARTCAEHGIALVCAYLPTVADVQRARYAAELDAAAAGLALAPGDERANDALADEWLAHARGRGIACLDLRPAFRAAEPTLYWHGDFHLNLAGNALVAAELAPLVLPALASD